MNTKHQIQQTPYLSKNIVYNTQIKASLFVLKINYISLHAENK